MNSERVIDEEQKVKERTEELYTELFDNETLKCDINNFLFTRVPETLTVGQLEKMACSVYDLIFESFERN